MPDARDAVSSHGTPFGGSDVPGVIRVGSRVQLLKVLEPPERGSNVQIDRARMLAGLALEVAEPVYGLRSYDGL